MEEILKKHKKQILDDLLEGKMMKSIMNKYNIPSMDDLYSFIYKYCEENNCELKRTDGRKRVFVPKAKKKVEKPDKMLKRNLEMILEIRDWAYKNGRLPKMQYDLSTAPREIQGTEEETPEELELRYHNYLNNLHTRLGLNFYKDESEIEDETLRKIYRVVKELKENFSTKIQYRIGRDLEEIEEWYKENKRAPKKLDLEYQSVTKKEGETKEEQETRLFNVLYQIKKYNYKKAFTEEELNAIRNKIFNIQYKYDIQFRKRLHIRLIEGIKDLTLKKRVPTDVIMKIAENYNVNIDEVVDELAEELQIGDEER